MNLDTYESPSDIYLACGDEVNPNRPIFTGDVFQNIEIPGVQEGGMGVVIAHPCTFRTGQGQLAAHILMASVERCDKQGRRAWSNGFFDQMPLTNLDGEDGYWAGNFDRLGRALVAKLSITKRLACLSVFGVNMLQQRLTCHLTRAKIPTATFNEAFAHTFEEADLLEDWTDTLVAAGETSELAAAAFEAFVRDGSPSPQAKLLDPQLRSAVRKLCRDKATQLAKGPAPELA